MRRTLSLGVPLLMVAMLAALAVGCSSSSGSGGGNVGAPSSDASAGDAAALDAAPSGDGAAGCVYLGPYDGGASGNLATLDIPALCKGSSGYNPNAPGYSEDVTQSTCGSMTAIFISLGVDATETDYYDTATGALLGAAGAANADLICDAWVPGFQVPTSCGTSRQLCLVDGGPPTDAEAGAVDAGGD